MEKGPSKFSLLIIIGFFASAIFMFFWQFHWSSTEIVLSGQILDVLVAKTPTQWHKGVGGRQSLEPHDGMLFVFGESSRQTIVMRDTLFPLDIIWLEKGVVVDMAPNVPTEIGKAESELRRYHPRSAGNMVLELPAGWIDAHGLKIGDKMVQP
jgi:uncharacterized membrane protein (UPF0127 family)